VFYLKINKIYLIKIKRYMSFSRKFLNEVRFESKIYRKIANKKNSIFFLDSNVCVHYLNEGLHKELFDQNLLLCASPTVCAELRENGKPSDFYERVKNFEHICSEFGIEMPEEDLIESNQKRIRKEILEKKGYNIRREMEDLKIFRRSEREEFFAKRSKEDWIQDQDIRIIAEVYCMKNDLEKNCYFVTADVKLLKYVPETIIEIIMPQAVY